MKRFAWRSLPEPPPIVLRFDLDKTYLQTKFETLRGLARIPFEGPEDKQTIPGVVPLVRGLRASADASGRECRIYFLSASPPQLGDTIRAKLALDGIRYDGITFKDQLRNLMRGKFRNLREQIGYKLTALLRTHAELPEKTEQVLFGDDWESDPLIYSLYSDVCSGALEAPGLAKLLAAWQVDAELAREAVTLSAPLAVRPQVRRIFINLERRTPPAQFEPYGRRLVPTFNYVQTGACLYELGLLSRDCVAEIVTDVLRDPRQSRDTVAGALADLDRRGHIDPLIASQLAEELCTGGERPRLARLWRDWRVHRRQRRLPPIDATPAAYEVLAASPADPQV